MKNNVAVIIPVFNEAQTIAAVVQTVIEWEKAQDVIIVNDGSTDSTQQILGQFVSPVTVIAYEKNHGKGYAVARGIEKTSCDVILLLDGDMVGLTESDLDALIDPVLQGTAEMALGLVRFLRFKSFGPNKEITGERALLRSNIVDHLGLIEQSGYGLEMCLNRIHKQKRVVRVPLPTVYIVDKVKKLPLGQAVASYWKEWKEIMVHYF